jgi:DNA-binding MarR family transcriptional regulator
MNAVANFTSSEMRALQTRYRFLPADICQGPLWAMIVYLANARASGKRAYTFQLGLAANIPGTTALRYIDRLEDAGLAQRAPDDEDRRRTIVRLTDTGWDKMLGYSERAALAAATGTAKTRNGAECEASQSGGEAASPNLQHPHQDTSGVSNHG